MIVLGIDPGLASVGYGTVEMKEVGGKIKDAFNCLEYGLIKTAADSPRGDRLKKINNELSRLIKKYHPEIMVMERLYFFKNLKTAMPVSQAVGVILLTAAKNNTPVFEYTPLQTKMTITGYGRAEKTDVQKKIKLMLRLKEIPKPDDAADALAIAITYFLKEVRKQA